MAAKSARFGLQHLFAAMTIAAGIAWLCAYVARSYRDTELKVFWEAYLEGRVSRATARENVGEVVDSWPEMPPIRPTNQPWQDRKKVALPPPPVR